MHALTILTLVLKVSHTLPTPPSTSAKYIDTSTCYEQGVAASHQRLTPLLADCHEVADAFDQYKHYGVVLFTNQKLTTTNTLEALAVNTTTVATTVATSDSPSLPFQLNNNSPSVTLGDLNKRTPTPLINDFLTIRGRLHAPFILTQGTCTAQIKLVDSYESYPANMSRVSRTAWDIWEDCVAVGSKLGGWSRLGEGLMMSLGGQ